MRRYSLAGDRREQASEHQMLYFQRHPTDSDRDYFYDVFRTVQMLPAVAGLFDDRTTPSGCMASPAMRPRADRLLAASGAGDRRAGTRLHRRSWNTRFLGDLYQDLSEEARKTLCPVADP